MKLHKGIILVTIFFLAGSGISQQGVSMFSDRRARQIGDIITILIMEYSEASSRASTTTQKDNEHGIMASGGLRSRAYSPYYGVEGDIKNRFRGKASVTREGKLKTKITATITEIDANGNLVIEGRRTVLVNGEQAEATVKGTVRGADVSSANTVFSYQVADAEISYTGEGVVDQGQRPGFLTRLLNWIF